MDIYKICKQLETWTNKTKNEIDYDLQNLIKSWNLIKENAINSIAPALIHQESEIIKRTLRDMYDEETQNIYFLGFSEPRYLSKIFKILNLCILKIYQTNIKLDITFA